MLVDVLGTLCGAKTDLADIPTSQARHLLLSLRGKAASAASWPPTVCGAYPWLRISADTRWTKIVRETKEHEITVNVGSWELLDRIADLRESRTARTTVAGLLPTA